MTQRREISPRELDDGLLALVALRTPSQLG